MGFEFEGAFWQIQDRAIDLFFFCDIIINFLTPIQDERGHVNSNFKDISRDYINNWFFIDLTASMPLEMMVVFFPNAS